MPKVRPTTLMMMMVVMNQVIIAATTTTATVSYTENRSLIKKLLMLSSMHILLPPQLQNLPVRIRMLSGHKSRARSGSVLWHEPTRLEPNSASVAKRLWAHRPSPPLWRLFGATVETLPPWRGGGGGSGVHDYGLFFLGRRRFRRQYRLLLLLLLFLVFWSCCCCEVEEARGPVAGSGAWALATCLAWERRFGLEKRCVSWREKRFGWGWRFGGLGFRNGCGCGGRGGSGPIEIVQGLKVLLGRERVLHKIWQPFQLSQVVVLYQNPYIFINELIN